MNIGFFANIYIPTVSGVVTIIENYRKELERQGHKVYVFAAKQPGYKDKNPRVFRFRSVDLSYEISYPLPVLYSYSISKVIKKLNLDVVHTHHFLVCGQIAWYYAKKFNIPLVFTHHTRYDLYTHYLPYIPKEISKPLALSLCAFFANSCNTVIAPTQDIKDSLLANKVRKPIVVLPSGIDIERFSQCQGSKIREKYNIDEGKTVLITVSRLAPEKNISFLLKAFKKIHLKNPQTCFIIVGDGPSKIELKKEAENLGLKKEIIFAGSVEQKEIPFYYKAGDVFIFSSLSETQGMVIVEAMASGLPVVAVRACGVKDIIKNGKNGFLVSENLQEFNQLVLKLINNQDLKKVISQRAEQSVKEFSVEKATQKLIKIYDESIYKLSKSKTV